MLSLEQRLSFRVLYFMIFTSCWILLWFGFMSNRHAFFFAIFGELAEISVGFLLFLFYDPYFLTDVAEILAMIAIHNLHIACLAEIPATYIHPCIRGRNCPHTGGGRIVFWR